MPAQTHIPAYLNLSGQQMGLAGVGCDGGRASRTWGLIPAKWSAQQLMATKHWWRILPATPSEDEVTVSEFLSLVMVFYCRDLLQG